MDESGRAHGLAATLALYALARLGLVAVTAGVLAALGVPLVIAVLAGLLVAMPLSMVLFRGLRARLDAALETTVTRRRAERSALRSRLKGEDEAVVGSDPGGEGQPDSRTD
jgi:hypothetical protein